MPIVKVFKNHIKNCKVVTPTGRHLAFFNGKHLTSVEKDIEYLTEMSKEEGSYVYIDPKEPEIDTEELTEEGRIAKAKREAVEEFKKQQALAANHNSNSSPSPLNVATSKTVTPALASNSEAPAGVVVSNEPSGEVVAPSGLKISLPNTK